MATFVTAFTLPMKRSPENIMGSAIGLINTGGTLGGFVSPIVIGYLVAKPTAMPARSCFCHWRWSARR